LFAEQVFQDVFVFEERKAATGSCRKCLGRNEKDLQIEIVAS
jgi:hypothetical protein